MRQMFVVTFVLPLVVGCSMLPSMPQETLETATVVQNLKCEFQEALFEVDPGGTWLQHWNASFNLTLSVDEKGTINPSGSFSHPFAHPLLTVPFSASYSRETTRTEKITFVTSVPHARDRLKFTCPDRQLHRPLAGRIGVADILRRVLAMKEKAGIAETQLDYTLDFAIIRNINASPKFSVIPLSGKDLLDAGIKLDGSRQHDYTLQITMVEKKPAVCEFPELLKKYGTCPAVVATVPFEGKKKGGLGLKNGVSPFGVLELRDAASGANLDKATRELRRLNQRIP